MSYASARSRLANSERFANARSAAACIRENTAVGAESEIIWDQYRNTVHHFFEPFSRQRVDPFVRFYHLKTEWESDTASLSSITAIAMHPAYQQIIGMGMIAVPLILNELKENPGHWFWALKAITGEDPVRPEDRGQMTRMAEAWLRWGYNEGFCRNE